MCLIVLVSHVWLYAECHTLIEEWYTERDNAVCVWLVLFSSRSVRLIIKEGLLSLVWQCMKRTIKSSDMALLLIEFIQHRHWLIILNAFIDCEFRWLTNYAFFDGFSSSWIGFRFFDSGSCCIMSSLHLLLSNSLHSGLCVLNIHKWVTYEYSIDDKTTIWTAVKKANPKCVHHTYKGKRNTPSAIPGPSPNPNPNPNPNPSPSPFSQQATTDDQHTVRSTCEYSIDDVTAVKWLLMNIQHTWTAVKWITYEHSTEDIMMM